MSNEDNKTYSYEELRIFAKKVHDDMLEARETGSYVKAMGSLYSDDIVGYGWSLGPGLPNFYAKGKEEIMRIALGAEMSGHSAWKYPWIHYGIDPEQGVIWYNWFMESPWEKPDGTFYFAHGSGYSIDWYAGNMQCNRQDDLAETQPLKFCHHQGIAAGLAEPALADQFRLRRGREVMAAEAWVDHLQELREEYGQEVLDDEEAKKDSYIYQLYSMFL